MTIKNLLNHHGAEEETSKKLVLGSENQLINIDEDCPDEADLQSTKENYQTEIASQLSAKKKNIDDDEETFESVYTNLPDDLKYLKDCMHRAQGCCLLLILKLFLKEIYSISERWLFANFQFIIQFIFCSKF